MDQGAESQILKPNPAAREGIEKRKGFLSTEGLKEALPNIPGTCMDHHGFRSRRATRRVTLSLKVEDFDIGFADALPDDEDPAHSHIRVVPRTPGVRVNLPAGIEWVYWGSN
jgi:hypothetical protein